MQEDAGLQEAGLQENWEIYRMRHEFECIERSAFLEENREFFDRYIEMQAYK